jgi:hypothetical protein
VLVLSERTFVLLSILRSICEYFVLAIYFNDSQTKCSWSKNVADLKHLTRIGRSADMFDNTQVRDWLHANIGIDNRVCRAEICTIVNFVYLKIDFVILGRCSQWPLDFVEQYCYVYVDNVPNVSDGPVQPDFVSLSVLFDTSKC